MTPLEKKLMARVVITTNGEAVAADDDGTEYLGYTSGPPLYRWRFQMRRPAAKQNTSPSPR